MNYANTNHIKIEQAFKNKDIAKNVLKQLINAHRNKLIEENYFDQAWQKETFDDSFWAKAKRTKILQLEQKLVGFYEGEIIPKLRNEILKKIKQAIQSSKKKRAAMDIDTAANRMLEDLEKGLIEGELKVITEKCLKSSWWRKSEYTRRLDERKRISYACQIISDRAQVETAEYHGFSTTTGQGEDEDENIDLEEEYCYICEKLISEHDKIEKLVGSDFIACSKHCYGLYHNNRDNHKPFQTCSSCERKIPKSIGNTCKTCQNDQDDDNQQPLHTCPQCQQKRAWSDKWTKWKEIDPPVCSQSCLFEWVKEKLGWIPKRCNKCKKVKRADEGFLQGWEKFEGNFYCSEECKNKRSQNSQNDNDENFEKCDYCKERKNTGEFTWTSEGKFCSIQCHLNNLKKLRSYYLQALKNIEGFDTLLTDKEREEYIDNVQHAYSKFEFDNIIKEVSVIIAFKKQKNGGDDDDESDDLNKEKNDVISEINAEMHKEPEIILEDLEEINQGWAIEIQQATSSKQIQRIRVRVLLDIDVKRLDKQEEPELVTLLNQAKQATTYEGLQVAIDKIKKFRSSKVYQKYQSEIEQEEIRLQSLDPVRYKNEIENYFKDFIKDNDLTEEELNQETQQAINEAVADPKKKNWAEEAICQNGADNKLDKLYQKIETKIKQGKLTQEEREDLINEVQAFAIKNDYHQRAYEKKQEAMEVLLDSLENWEDRGDEQTFLEKHWPVIVASCLGVIVIGVVVWWMKGNLSSRKRIKTSSYT